MSKREREKERIHAKEMKKMEYIVHIDNIKEIQREREGNCEGINEKIKNEKKKGH